MSDAKLINLPVRLDGDVKQAMAREAASRGMSMNDVGLTELSDFFDEPYEPTGRGGDGARTDEGVFHFRRMPIGLRAKIDAYRYELPEGTRRDMRNVIQFVLRERLGLVAGSAI